MLQELVAGNSFLQNVFSTLTFYDIYSYKPYLLSYHISAIFRLVAVLLRLAKLLPRLDTRLDTLPGQVKTGTVLVFNQKHF